MSGVAAQDAKGAGTEVNHILGAGPGTSSAPDAPVIDRDRTGFLNTVDDDPAPSAQTLNADDGHTKTGDPASADDPNAKGDEGLDKDGKPLPFHLHPRFKQLETSLKDRDTKVNELTTALQKATAQIELLARMGKTLAPGSPPADGKSAKSIINYTNEELLEMFQDNPKNFLLQFYAEAEQNLRNTWNREAQEVNSKTAQKKTFDEYAGKNPDFLEKLKSGEIKKFIQEHPGHNIYSAHFELTMTDRIAAAEKKAAEDATKKATKDAANLKQAQENASSVLGSGPVPGRRASTVEPTLQNTKAGGGLVAALASRLDSMRSRAGRAVA